MHFHKSKHLPELTELLLEPPMPNTESDERTHINQCWDKTTHLGRTVLPAAQSTAAAHERELSANKTADVSIDWLVNTEATQLKTADDDPQLMRWPPPPHRDLNQYNPLLNFSQAAAVSWFPCSQQLVLFTLAINLWCNKPCNRQYDRACSSQENSYPWMHHKLLPNNCICCWAELQPNISALGTHNLHYLFDQGLLISLRQYLNGQIYTLLDLDGAQGQYFMDFENWLDVVLSQ